MKIFFCILVVLFQIQVLALKSRRQIELLKFINLVAKPQPPEIF